MIKAIILDMAGVYFFNYTPNVAIMLKQQHGLDEAMIMDAIGEMDKRGEVGKITSNQYFAGIIKKLGLKMTPEHLASIFKKHIILDFEVYDLTKILKSKGYKLAVLSNSMKEISDYMRKSFDMEHFDAIIFSNEIKVRKRGRPARRPLRITCAVS